MRELSEGNSAADVYPNALSAVKMAKDAGADMAAALLIAGPGSTLSQEYHFYILEAFKAAESYGVGCEKLMGATMGKINAVSSDAMGCDAPRL